MMDHSVFLSYKDQEKRDTALLFNKNNKSYIIRKKDRKKVTGVIKINDVACKDVLGIILSKINNSLCNISCPLCQCILDNFLIDEEKTKYVFFGVFFFTEEC